MRMYVQHKLPIGRKRMKKVRLAPDIQRLVADKIESMCRRFYLESSGHVSNSLNYFAVPKGDADIRVVFDGTSSGLNDVVGPQLLFTVGHVGGDAFDVRNMDG